MDCSVTDDENIYGHKTKQHETQSLATKVFYTTLDAFKNTINDKRNTFTEVQKEELTNIIMPAYHTKNMIKLTKILKTFGTVYEMHGGNPIVLAEGIDAINKHKVRK